MLDGVRKPLHPVKYFVDVLGIVEEHVQRRIHCPDPIILDKISSDNIIR